MWLGWIWMVSTGLQQLFNFSASFAELKTDVVPLLKEQNSRTFSEFRPIPPLVNFAICLQTCAVANGLAIGLSLWKLQTSRLKTCIIGLWTVEMNYSCWLNFWGFLCKHSQEGPIPWWDQPESSCWVCTALIATLLLPGSTITPDMTTYPPWQTRKKGKDSVLQRLSLVAPAQSWSDSLQQTDYSRPLSPPRLLVVPQLCWQFFRLQCCHFSPISQP